MELPYYQNKRSRKEKLPKGKFWYAEGKKMLSKAKCHKPVSLPSLVNRPSAVSRLKKKNPGEISL